MVRSQAPASGAVRIVAAKHENQVLWPWTWVSDCCCLALVAYPHSCPYLRCRGTGGAIWGQHGAVHSDRSGSVSDLFLPVTFYDVVDNQKPTIVGLSRSENLGRSFCGRCARNIGFLFRCDPLHRYRVGLRSTSCPGMLCRPRMRLAL
jgi:hypothetical protein